MSYYKAPALAVLERQVDQRFPHRDQRSDGWIGDTSHSARASDHNPDRAFGGVVRAIDFDIDPDGRADADLRTELIRAAVQDPRTYYVISNGVIYSRTHAFQPRRYTGVNPHNGHVHISLRGGVGDPGLTAEKKRAIVGSTAAWALGPAVATPVVVKSRLPQKAKNPKVGVSLRTLQQVIRTESRERLHQVELLQRALVLAGYQLKVDGRLGPSTKTIFRAFQRDKLKWRGASLNGLPGETSLLALQDYTRGSFEAIR